MDDNTRQVLVAIASGLIGLAAGVLIAKIGFDHARAMAKEGRAADDELRATEHGRRERERWIDRRREVYTELIAACATIWLQTTGDDEFPLDQSIRAYSALAEVTLMRPSLKDAGSELVSATIAKPQDLDRREAAEAAFSAAARADLASAPADLAAEPAGSPTV